MTHLMGLFFSAQTCGMILSPRYATAYGEGYVTARCRATNHPYEKGPLEFHPTALILFEGVAVMQLQMSDEHNVV